MERSSNGPCLGVSSLTIRAADGGHVGNSFLHFVLLTWVSCGTAVLTEAMIAALLDVNL